ncbi:MAG: phosphoethanolamine transferase [Muribaculaceae bacterium]|nr:phosphoethanolamine transferase [Muribaculaceae bacterium]
MSWLSFSMSVTFIYSLIFLSIEFAGSPFVGFKGFALLVAQWLIATVCCGGIMGAISVSRLSFALLFPLMCTASAALAFFKVTMNVQLTPVSIELMMLNEARTWSTVMSPALFFVILIALIAGIAIAVIRWRCVTVKHPLDCLMLSVIVILIPGCFIPRLYVPVMERMPFVFYGAFAEYRMNRIGITEHRTTFDDIDALAPDGAPDVVFVIGESLRADHLSLNGYSRTTTPLLASDTAVISFPGMHTIPCYTHTSVPHIMTPADSVSPLRAYDDQSFITLFRKAGFTTTWIENQNVSPTFTYFLHEADTLIYPNPSRSHYDFGKWLDSDILPVFDSFALRGDRNLAIVHTKGSHWWYNSHYTDDDALFTPEIDSRLLSELSQEQIVNSYDNTILATDRFLYALIDRLRYRNAVLIFISDHGEALGEDGNYLHGDDYPTLHNPACFIWYSDEYASHYPEKVRALRMNASKRWLTDVMFHTALDAASICTEALIDSLSLFRQ